MQLSSLYQYFASHPEADWIIDWHKARYLYNYVKEHPEVKRVLDLGTGIGATAAIVALALKNKGEQDYEIHTVEQFQKCYDLAQKLIPNELKEHTTFHLSKPIVWNEERIPYHYFSIFEKLPEGDFDLVLVDGPGPWEADGHYIDLPNGDVMKMLIEGKLKTGNLIAWDGRIQAGKLLERFFSENFYLAFSGEGTNFRILEVKEPEAKFLDDEFEGIKMGGYFKEASNVGPPSRRMKNPWDPRVG